MSKQFKRFDSQKGLNVRMIMNVRETEEMKTNLDIFVGMTSGRVCYENRMFV